MSRSIEVDLATFDTYFSQGWSLRKLHKATGLARATISKIKKTGKGSETSVEIIAKAFGTTLDCLRANSPRTDQAIHLDPLKEEYKNILRSALHSAAYANYAKENGGLFAARFLPFVNSNRQLELNALHLSPNGRIQVHEELCRDGLLTKQKIKEENGKEVTVYSCREWSDEQCLENLNLRIGIEKICVERALRLLDRNPIKHQDICDVMKNILHLMEESMPYLSRNSNDEVALQVLGWDAKFHKAWAGDAPDYKAVMCRSVFGHGQIINRYILLIRTAAQKKDVPKYFPTLSSIAQASFTDLVEIYELFIAIKSTNDADAIKSLMDTINEHPRKNWEKMKLVEKFNRDHS